ncbi:MAG: hypothetical protein ACRD0S_01505 [Acidimicrobiales bacterium]
MKLRADRKPTVEEQIRERNRILAQQEGWPSASLGPGATPVLAGLPAGLPPLPQLAPPPPEVVAARKEAEALAGALGPLEGRLEAAHDDGDGAAVLAVRREREEAEVAAWSARLAAVSAEAAWYDGETRRLEPLVAPYEERLAEVRARLRTLQDEERALASAAHHVLSLMGRAAEIGGRLAGETDRLRRGPAAMSAATKEGWA